MSLLGNLGNMLAQTDRALERWMRVPTLTLDTCIAEASKVKKEYPQITAFLLRVENLGAPEEDGLNIIVAYLDKDEKAITTDGVTGVVSSWKANTVDQKIIDLLNGEQNAIYEL